MRALRPLILIALIVAGCSGGTATASLAASSAGPSMSAAAGETATMPGGEPSATIAATATPTTAPTPTAHVAPTPSPTMNPSEPYPTPVVSSVTVQSAAPDGRWRATFKKPVLSGVSAAVASDVNTRIGAEVSAFIAGFTKGGLPVMQDGQPSTLEGEYSVAFLDAGLLSLRLSDLTYVSGAATGNADVETLNFDLTSGKVLAMAGEFQDVSSALAILSSQSRSQLAEQFPDTEDWINGGTTPTADHFRAWAFTTAGLEITFQEGQVAPDAAGNPVVVVPWSVLSPAVKPGSAAAMFTSFSG